MSEYHYDFLNILYTSAVEPRLDFNNSEQAFWEFVHIVFGKVNKMK